MGRNALLSTIAEPFTSTATSPPPKMKSTSWPDFVRQNVDGLSGTLQIEALAMELDELSLPYKFDVKSLTGISNPALIDHIARVGVNLYP